MTRVMDGVARVAAKPTPVVMVSAPVVRQPVAAAPKRPVGRPPQRASIGRFDGIRSTPQRPQPAPIAKPAQPPVATSPIAPFIAPALPQPVRHVPMGWRRPAMGFAMVALAITASTVAVRTLSTPRASTARAEQAAKLTSALTATPAPTASASATPAPTATPVAADLQTLLNTFAAAQPGKFAIVVKDLKTGATATVDASRPMTSASLYKLFVAQRTFQRVDLGQAQLTSAAGGGTGKNIQGCLNVMIVVSDNGCGRALGTLLGWGAQNHSLEIEGYPGTSLATPQKTSATDVATLFERLYRGTLLSKASSDQFMALLKSQRVNNRLPQGLPAGTVFAHKTGDLDGYTHDAGIVYGPKTDYLVVVMSGSWSVPGSSPAMFANLSKQLWNYFEN